MVKQQCHQQSKNFNGSKIVSREKNVIINVQYLSKQHKSSDNVKNLFYIEVLFDNNYLNNYILA